MKRLPGSLTSLAKGRYFRAYYDVLDEPVIGENVVVVDEMAETEQEGRVVRFSGPFVYVDSQPSADGAEQ